MIARTLLRFYQWRIARWIARHSRSALDRTVTVLKLVKLRKRERLISNWMRRPNLVRLIRLAPGGLSELGDGYGYPCFYREIQGGIELLPPPKGVYELFILDRGPHSAALDRDFPPVREVVGPIYSSAGFVAPDHGEISE